ncbi:TolB family protein [Aquipuribacter sp. MA13-6]|uniref:TolB family protein n=1 Tax=unclassified Aquipuribacter TaxID=2635084 RepID=UPI003EE83784
MSRRTRLVVLTVLIVVALVVSVGAVWVRVAEQREIAATEPRLPTTSLEQVLQTPHVVFRSTSRDSSYGQVAVVPVADADGPRALTGVPCERVFSTTARHLCLQADRGVVTTYRTVVLGPSFQEEHALPLAGLPSRARLSRDGSLAATTTFVTGHSYAGGDFSTETVVREVAGDSYGNIQEFALTVDGAPLTAADLNVWGVTFADDDRFFATAASGGTTWLVEGSLSGRTLSSLREDAECPSLSPDGRRVAYKKREGALDGTWRLAVLDLSTGQERLLSETRSVDDQVEWLDDGTLLYGLPREGSDAGVSDVWRLPVDGEAPAEVFIPEAWSPAVVRGDEPATASG